MKKDQEKTLTLLEPRLFLERLKQTCRRLKYISEADFDLEPFLIEKPGPDKRKAIRDLFGIPGVRFMEADIEEILTHIKADEGNGVGSEREPEIEADKLRTILITGLLDPVAMVSGRTVKDIFIVGTDRNGNLAGVRTRSVET